MSLIEKNESKFANSSLNEAYDEDATVIGAGFRVTFWVFYAVGENSR